MLWNVLSLFVYFVSLCLHVTIPTLDRLLLGISKILSEACTIVAGLGAVCQPSMLSLVCHISIQSYIYTYSNVLHVCFFETNVIQVP